MVMWNNIFITFKEYLVYESFLLKKNKQNES